MQLVSRILIQQWEETAITKMERSAHDVDMRLMQPKQILQFFLNNRSNQQTTRDLDILFKQLQNVEGVIAVKFKPLKPKAPQDKTMMRMHHLQKTYISPLNYDDKNNGQTISIIAQLVDSNEKPEAEIEVVVSFYDLIDQIVKAPWWQGNKAFLIDQNGIILAQTDLNNLNNYFHDQSRRVFGKNSLIEERTWQSIQQGNHGTLFSEGMPPEMVSGFYQLHQAPWTLVVIAEGEKVLQPILQFKTYYYSISVISIIIVALYIWFMTNKATTSINRISNAAKKLAEGKFDSPLKIESKDEIGHLTNSFNSMSHQLEERLKLREEMNLAGEIQNSLLPQNDIQSEKMEVALSVKYCDATGGDYVDVFHTNQQKDDEISIVIGDVVGHGLSAALLMTTMRALFRSRMNLSGSLEDITSDVNKLLCKDTVRFGNFATLFLLRVNSSDQTIRWVRCGHDPALVYSPISDTFYELKGEGVALGLDADIEFKSNTLDFFNEEQIILLGTDGIWDAVNSNGECFGKERVKRIIKKFAASDARTIAEMINKEIDDFTGNISQEDDITLAIIKTK